MNKKKQDIAARYGRNLGILEMAREIMEEQYRVSAFTNPGCPVITPDHGIQVYHWGLIPHWVKSKDDADDIRKKTYNARAESIFGKPSYMYSITSRRCLVPSTGYFEWRHEGNKKIPYYIYVRNEEIFSMGGIYDEWENPGTKESIHTFSLITTGANELTGYIHNAGQNPGRMPLIISREDEAAWLSHDLIRKDIETLMKPYPADRMDAYVIHSNFLRKNAHDASILEKV